MQGILNICSSSPPCVRIGDSSNNFLLREGLLDEISHLNNKEVNITSHIINEYNGKTVVMILGLKQVENECNAQKRMKTEHTAPSIKEPDAQQFAPTPITNLAPSLNICFSGRVIKKSEIRKFKSGKGELFNMDIEDSSGTIRCTAFNPACDRLHKQIYTGNHYKIIGGTLKPTNTQYNNTGHLYELTMSDRTNVEELKKDDNYTNIDMLLPGNTYTTRGIVLVCGDLIEFRKEDRVNQRRTIVIGDKDESCIEITIFGKSDTIHIGSYIKVSMMKISIWQDKITGTTNANAISFINTPDANTEWFVNMYDNDREHYEELIKLWIAPRCTIENFVDSGVLCCTIIELHTDEGSCPWYIACEKCKKKLVGADEYNTRSLCEKCGTEMNGIRRWILNLNCSDESGGRMIKMYDECASKLLTMTADEFVHDYGLDRIDILKQTLTYKRVKLECIMKKNEEEESLVCQKLLDINYSDEGSRTLQRIT